MSALRRAALLACAVITLSACQVDVVLETIVASDGSGVFRLGVGADRELREMREPEGGLKPMESLFAGLAERGWSVARSEPDGGLRITASKPFANPSALDEVLSELRSARTSPNAGDLGSVDLSLALSREPGFFESATGFVATLDTSALADLGPELIAELRRLVRFEFRTQLPGSAKVREGAADIEGGTVVWRPQLGEDARLEVASVQRSTGAYLGMLFAAISLLLFVAALLAARRRRSTAAGPEDYERLRPLEVKRPAEPE